MNYLKPILGPIQERMKNASTQEEKLLAQQELMVANVKMESACLVELGKFVALDPKMPFFSALFFAAQHTKGVADSSFLWHCSWQTKLALDGYRCGSFLLYPSMLSLHGIEDETQRKACAKHH